MTNNSDLLINLTTNMDTLYSNNANFTTTVALDINQVLRKEWHLVMISILTAISALLIIGLVAIVHYYNVKRGAINADASHKKVTNKLCYKLCPCCRPASVSHSQSHSVENSTVSQQHSETTHLPTMASGLANYKEITTTDEAPFRKISSVPRLPPLEVGGHLITLKQNENDRNSVHGEYASIGNVYTQLPENANHPMNNNIFRMGPLNN